MILTRQQKLFRGNGSAPNARAIADGVITALSPAAWYRNATDVVSSGGFASVWADQSTDVVALNCPGTSGNYASTPDSVAISLTGDVEIVGRISLVDWTPTSPQGVWGTLNAPATVGVQFRVETTTGRLTFGWGNGVTFTTVNSTASPTVTDGDTLWIKVTVDVDRGDSKYEVKFWTAPDQSAEPSSWTQLGSTVVGAAAMTIADGESGTIGFLTATGSYTAGKIYRVIVRSGIGGTAVFDADFTAQTEGATSFTESSSNAATVTINTSGAIPARLSKGNPLLQATGTNQPAYAAGVLTFDGADNTMLATSWSMVQPETIYAVFKQESWTNFDYLFDGSTSNTGAVYQNSSSPNFTIYAGSGGGNNGNLAVGSFGILCVVFNGASSSSRVNNTAKVTGNPGAGNMGGFRIAAAGSSGHLSIMEAVIFAAAHSDAEQDSVITALNNALTVF